MEVDPRYRVGGAMDPETSRTPWWAVILVAIIGCIAVFYFLAEPHYKYAALNWFNSVTGRNSASEDSRKEFSEVYKHLGISPLPDRVITSRQVAPHLDVLKREKCDKAAMYAFARGLSKNNYRRHAANALVSFSSSCGTDEEAIARAYLHYSEINAADEMIKTANTLISMKSYASRYFYWRGLGYRKQGEYELALNDFITTINLANNKGRVRSTVFINQAEMYDKLGRVCEAITPIQTWVSLDPVSRNSVKAKALIQDYAKRGDCDAQYANGTATFPVSNIRRILVTATINGTKGNFLLDTGASYVSISKNFADKAKITSNARNVVRLQTANGIVPGQSVLLNDVSVKEARASNITAVIMGDKNRGFGPGIDGLLGLSFLARFELKVSSTSWSIQAKSAQ